jgi:HSP20 family protein
VNEEGLRRELRYGSFQRQLRLPPTVDAEKAQATFEHGVMKLTLPKKPEARSRSFKITPQGVIEGPAAQQAEQQ